MTGQPNFPLTETLAMLRKGTARQRVASNAATGSIVGFDAQAETLRAASEQVAEQAHARISSVREAPDA